MKCFIGTAIGIILVLIVYGSFTGTPWGLAKWERGAKEYLISRFEDTMVIKDIEYDFDNSSWLNPEYFAVAHPKNNLNITFRVQKFKGYYSDNFLPNYWMHEIENELLARFKSMTIDYYLPSFSTRDLPYDLSKAIPSHHEVRAVIGREWQSELTVSMQGSPNDDSSLEQLLSLVTFVNKQDYGIYEMKINLQDPNQGTQKYSVKGKDLTNIKELTSLRKYLQLAMMEP
jgi:hypothetical protein